MTEQQLAAIERFNNNMSRFFDELLGPLPAQGDGGQKARTPQTLKSRQSPADAFLGLKVGAPTPRAKGALEKNGG